MTTAIRHGALEAWEEASPVSLRAALGRTLARADARGEACPLIWREPVAARDVLLDPVLDGTKERFHWQHPGEGRALVARGSVLCFEGWGDDRFARAADFARALFARALIAGPSPDAAHVSPRLGPLLVGGFAFSPGPVAASAAGGHAEWSGFPAARLWLPRLLVAREADVMVCSVAALVEPGAGPGDLLVLERRIEAELARLRAGAPAGAWAGDGAEVAVAFEPEPEPGFEAGHEYRVVADRPHSVYRAQVAEALEEIGRGGLEKVVLARSLEVFHPGRFEIEAFVARLREIHPACVTFAVAPPVEERERVFVAASPERLVSLAGDRVQTCALAGSAPRGRTPEEDERLGRGLRESKKDQAEHATVVRAIRARLADVCGELDGDEAPDLLRLDGIQHLATPLNGRLRSEARAVGDGPLHVLDLVARLHPTPAVAGLPQAPACDWLAAREDLARGWYAGPVGFVDAEGGGEFWVGLRSALIDNPDDRPAIAHARLFAGAGIVQGSVPEYELRETRLKLRALLAPLTEI